jgi:hypothetical protein
MSTEVTKRSQAGDVTSGEIVLRLSVPDGVRLAASHTTDATSGWGASIVPMPIARTGTPEAPAGVRSHCFFVEAPECVLEAAIGRSETGTTNGLQRASGGAMVL